jgi:D-galactarolactone cycloisomerase
MVETLSGVDIALWDLRGKQEERSVSHLLADALGIAPSAIRTQIPCYATGLFYEPLPELLAEARSYVDQGFRAIKMKIGLGLEEDLARVRAVREAIGPDIVLKVDANCAYDLAGARRMDERLREFDIDWFEEPLRVEDLEGYVALSDANQIRIATGEGAYLRWGFAELLPFIDVAQPDVIRAGGLSELVHIMRQARDAGVSVSPHAWAGAVCLAASIHLSAVAPTFETFEYDRTPNPLREQLTREPFRCENGVLDVPTSPGLGIDLDSEAVVRYVVAVT